MLNMRIAVISDIHGNLMGLDAVENDIEKMGVDEVWCGGDVAWGGPWGARCVERVRDAGWTTVKGNTDVWITGDPQATTTETERNDVIAMAAAHNLSVDDRDWLLNLPLGHKGLGGLLMVHGTPDSPFVAPLPEAPPIDFAPYEGKSSVVVYGHVHRGFVRRLADGTLVANAGSVGFPMDGEFATYLIIDQTGPDWTFTHRRVAFDRRAVMAQARVTGGAIERWTTEKLGA